jgi:hypothetical protein
LTICPSKELAVLLRVQRIGREDTLDQQFEAQRFDCGGRDEKLLRRGQLAAEVQCELVADSLGELTFTRPQIERTERQSP